MNKISIKSHIFITLFIIIIVMNLCNIVLGAGVELFYSSAVNKLFIDPSKSHKYQKIIDKFGLDLGKEYPYAEYMETQHINEIGKAGNYEFLKRSNGGGWDDAFAEAKFYKLSKAWQIFYFKNHNISILEEYSHSSDMSHTFVKILKVARGRRPNLNLE